MDVRQELRPELQQRLVMTPKLQQAIKLLQMPALELQQKLKHELLHNPMLEDVEEAGEDEDGQESEAKAAEDEGEFKASEGEIDWDRYLKDGFEMGTKKVDKILDRIHGTLQDIVAYRQEFIKRYEKETLHLICAIAEKVVRGAVKVDNQIVREAILEAFSFAVDRSEVTVRVNPEEVEYVKEIRPEFFDRISELKSITIESDPSITPGGCFMETAFGSVDARLETQLEKIAKAVERAFEIDD